MHLYHIFFKSERFLKWEVFSNLEQKEFTLWQQYFQLIEQEKYMYRVIFCYISILFLIRLLQLTEFSNFMILWPVSVKIHISFDFGYFEMFLIYYYTLYVNFLNFM